jgi:hypothetical protein
MLYSTLLFLSFCMDFGIAETGIARGSPPGTTTEVLRVGFPFAEIRVVSLSRYKDAILVFRAWMHYFGVRKLRCIHSTLVDPKWCFGVFETISITFGHKRWKTCVSGMSALFKDSEIGKHPFYSIRPKMLFGSVSKHLANLRHVKRCKTCVSGQKALF